MRKIKVDYGSQSQAVLLTFCSCKKQPQLEDYHTEICWLITAIKILDDIVDWAVWETYTAMNSEEAPRGVDTVELPKEEGHGGGSVGEPSAGEG